MRRNVFSVVILVGALTALGPVAAWAQSSIVGVVKDYVWRRAAGRDRRSREPGAHREGAHRRDRQPGPLQHRRSAARRVLGHVHAYSGFQTVKREDLDLPAAFTATVNAELAGRQYYGDPDRHRRSAGRRSARLRTSADALAGTARKLCRPARRLRATRCCCRRSRRAWAPSATAPNSFRWADMQFRGTREASTVGRRVRHEPSAQRGWLAVSGQRRNGAGNRRVARFRGSRNARCRA